MARIKSLVPTQDDKYDDFPYSTNCLDCGAEINLHKDFEEGNTFSCHICKAKFKAVKPTPLTILAMRFKNMEEE